MIKSVPIGIEDFAQVENKFYIDKTLIIKDIIDSCLGASVLITRPRRFGKSLTLSMIGYFFTNKYDSKSLFENKKIALEGNKYLQYMNAYPVIRLNMKNISHGTYDEMMKAVINVISLCFRRNKDVLNDISLFDVERKKYLSIANMEYNNPSDYIDSISFLCDLLYQKYHKKHFVNAWTIKDKGTLSLIHPYVDTITYQ